MACARRWPRRNRRYSRRINFREGWRGYLFQGRLASYPLTDVTALGAHVRKWRAKLRVGLETMDDPGMIEAIEACIRTGRKLAEPAWIAEMEQRIARRLGPMKRGPKPKALSLV